MQVVAILLGLTGCGWLLIKIGAWYFEHRQGAAKSLGAATVLTGVVFLITALAIIWILRILHLFR